MAPVRRPALAQSWLLHPRHQTLSRVIEAVRPLVLPKLREEKERERSKKKPSKKSRVKDVIVQDDFEVSMFLTETSTRHSILSKRKHFREKGPLLMQSNTTKLIDETNDQPVDVDGTDFAPVRLEDESGDEEITDLSAIPAADTLGGGKRGRHRHSIDVGPEGGGAEETAIDVNSDDEEPPSKRRREIVGPDSESDGESDKKKLAMDVSYEGFAIYGRVLCLIVKRRDTGAKAHASSAAGGGLISGQAKMENWITSTQMPAEEA